MVKTFIAFVVGAYFGFIWGILIAYAKRGEECGLSDVADDNTKKQKSANDR